MADIRRLSAALHWPVECAFDVGANIGQTSHQILREFPACHVFAFEPHPEAYKELQKAVPIDRVSAYELALSSTPEVMTFYVYDGEGAPSTINSLTRNARFARRCHLRPRELTVSSSTVDDFCREHAIHRINILKIDAEGHDHHVLRGAERMLSDRRIDFVQVEFNDFLEQPDADGGSLNAIGEYLGGYDFQFVATYSDYVLVEDGVFVVANVLAARRH
jgi:FkbM family methyltransferase